MTQRLAITLLTLLLGGSVLTLSAQQDQQEPIEPVSSGQEETRDAENNAAALEETEADEETDTETSPFDYQSSEKISEDLSVSFPVDI